jgi:pyrimidine-nucleoside phosphorylase
MGASGGGDSLDACRAMAEKTISNGTAFQKLCDMVYAQGGNPEALRDFSLLPQAAFKREVLAPRGGCVQSMNTERWGAASVQLGAGRAAKDSPIDYGAGIILHKKTGAYVRAGDVIATLYAGDEGLLEAAARTALDGTVIGDEKPEDEPLVYGVVG